VTAGAAAGGLLAQAPLAQAQAPAGTTPIGPPWWPSRWGAGDEAGASNHITPAKVLEVVRLIKTGTIYELGRLYQSEQPAFGARGFLLRIVGSPTNDEPFGTNKLVYHDEFLATEIGQCGTQFDGLAHIGCEVGKRGDLAEMRFYNGFTELDLYSANGMKKLGIEKIKPIFTRGVLVDMVAFRGRNLNLGEEITPADLLGALARQGIAEASFRPGDAIFFRTGWSEQYWIKDNAKYNEGCPGIGLAAAQWIAQKQLCVAGADTWPVEVVPSADPNRPFVCHQELLTKNGIFLHENLDLSEVARNRVYEFVYVMTPLRIKGATGSPGRPIAIA
jgi:kynurenine formamidase